MRISTRQQRGYMRPVPVCGQNQKDGGVRPLLLTQSFRTIKKKGVCHSAFKFAPRVCRPTATGEGRRGDETMAGFLAAFSREANCCNSSGGTICVCERCGGEVGPTWDPKVAECRDLFRDTTALILLPISTLRSWIPPLMHEAYRKRLFYHSTTQAPEIR